MGNSTIFFNDEILPKISASLESFQQCFMPFCPYGVLNWHVVRKKHFGWAWKASKITNTSPVAIIPFGWTRTFTLHCVWRRYMFHYLNCTCTKNNCTCPADGDTRQQRCCMMSSQCKVLLGCISEWVGTFIPLELRWGRGYAEGLSTRYDKISYLPCHCTRTAKGYWSNMTLKVYIYWKQNFQKLLITTEDRMKGPIFYKHTERETQNRANGNGSFPKNNVVIKR